MNITSGPLKIVIVGMIAAAVSGCGGHKVLKEAQPMPTTDILSAADDGQLTASLDWVIVRDGPGTWSRDADWDQYLLTMHNRGASAVDIRGATLYDSLDYPAAAQSNRKQLVKGSKKTVKRYKNQGLEVKAGLGGGTMLLTGSAVGAAAVSAGTAMATVGAGTAAGAGAVAVGLLAAPVLLGGGIVKGVNNSKVAGEIEARHTILPLQLQPGETQHAVFFFPLAPSPQRLEINYQWQGKNRTLIVDTTTALEGLHIGATAVESR